jgi:hypothetical protein
MHIVRILSLVFLSPIVSFSLLGGTGGQPGDPNPKGIGNYPTSVSVPESFDFTATERNIDACHCTLTNLIYHFKVSELASPPPPTGTLVFNVPVAGYSAQFPLGVSLPSGQYPEVYLVPNTPQNLAYHARLAETFSMTQAWNAGQAQLEFSLLSDQYLGDAWATSGTITVN